MRMRTVNIFLGYFYGFVGAAVAICTANWLGFAATVPYLTPQGEGWHMLARMYPCGSVFEAPAAGNLVLFTGAPWESVPLWFIFPRFLWPTYVPPLALGVR